MERQWQRRYNRSNFSHDLVILYDQFSFLSPSFLILPFIELGCKWYHFLCWKMQNLVDIDCVQTGGMGSGITEMFDLGYFVL